MKLLDPRIPVIEGILLRACTEHGGKLYAGSLFNVHQLAIEILRAIEFKREVLQ